ncbi:purine-nucleoside phosphorylase [Arcanobacterium haemolyticum]|nr:purine-nucleoside phosphorylase [Arcanobacterium haemolyticum]
MGKIPEGDVAQNIRERFGIGAVDAALVLGSGWGSLVDSWPEPVGTCRYDDVGLHPPVAPGHDGILSLYDLGGQRVLVFAGRTHLYEGHGPVEVGRNVRISAELGARTLVLTNANGALVEEWPLGQVMVLNDHLNLTGTSPLVGANFVDLTDAYSSRLRALVTRLAGEDGIVLVEGVYAMLPGPHYESASEARAIAGLGAQALGMSTVLETIQARACGMEVLALSTVTAHEASGEVIDPDEVVAIAMREAGRLGPALARLFTHEENK